MKVEARAMHRLICTATGNKQATMRFVKIIFSGN
jgi:hypothetical protein